MKGILDLISYQKRRVKLSEKAFRLVMEKGLNKIAKLCREALMQSTVSPYLKLLLGMVRLDCGVMAA